MPRKNVSISRKHEGMLDELEETGVGKEIFGDGFVSAMFQYILERTYRERFRVEYIKREVKELELEKVKEKQKRLNDEIERLDENIDDSDSSKEIDEEKEEFFDKYIEDVLNRSQKSRISFEEQYKQWENGRLRKFRKRYYRIDIRTFRKHVKEKAEEKGYGHKVEFLEHN